MPVFAAAHRGLWSEHPARPENTLFAFQEAVQAGFPALELDLRLTGDGEVVVLHDATLSRTTNGQGEVADMGLAEVQAFDTGVGPVPTLAALFAALERWGGLYDLEVKSADALEPTVEMAKARIPGRFQVSSKDSGIVLEARDLDPAMPLALIQEGAFDAADWDTLETAECQWVNVQQEFLDEHVMQMARARGLRVAAWTVNSPRHAHHLAGMGVECIITNVRAVLESLKKDARAWATSPGW